MRSAPLQGSWWKPRKNAKRAGCGWKGESYPRTIHPYGVCQTSRGNMIIVCWQVAGFSGSGQLPAYKSLKIDQCERLEILTQKFIPQSNFNPADPLYKRWMFHV